MACKICEDDQAQMKLFDQLAQEDRDALNDAAMGICVGCYDLIRRIYRWPPQEAVRKIVHAIDTGDYSEF